MGLTTGVSGAGAVGAVSASGGFVVWSGYSDNSLTARVSAINAGYTTTGDFAVSQPTTPLVTCSSRAVQLIWLHASLMTLSSPLVWVASSALAIQSDLVPDLNPGFKLLAPLPRGGVFLSF